MTTGLGWVRCYDSDLIFRSAKIPVQWSEMSKHESLSSTTMSFYISNTLQLSWSMGSNWDYFPAEWEWRQILSCLLWHNLVRPTSGTISLGHCLIRLDQYHTSIVSHFNDVALQWDSSWCLEPRHYAWWIDWCTNLNWDRCQLIVFSIYVQVGWFTRVCQSIYLFIFMNPLFCLRQSIHYSINVHVQ